MARHVVVVYREDSNGRRGRSKRPQAVGLATATGSTTTARNGPAATAARKKAARTIGGKGGNKNIKSDILPAAGIPIVGSGTNARAVAKKTKTKAATIGNKSTASLAAFQVNNVQQPLQILPCPQQQYIDQVLQALPPNGTGSGPFSRKPPPGQKLLPSHGAQAAPKFNSSSSIQITEHACSQDRFSSTSTLVATSNVNSSFLHQGAFQQTSGYSDTSSTPNPPPKDAKKRPASSSPSLPWKMKGLLPSKAKKKNPEGEDHQAIAAEGASRTTSDHSRQRRANEDATLASHPICARLSSVLTSIDGETFRGNEDELNFWHQVDETQYERPRGGFLHSNNVDDTTTNLIPKQSPTKTSFFMKVNLYANSRLPPNLPQFKVHLPLYPLICLSAKYSQSVYQRPMGNERETHIEGDWRMGTKAMIMKSIPVDHKNIIVFAIRGSHSFIDWAVNINSKPVSAEHFLDDPGNLCHSGFLTVARRMLRPVAARLRALLEENPARSSCSLILTGHSAGGAVASLLYAHMVAQNVSSELNILTQCFKRIHCFTFGAPPVSLLPLQKPSTPHFQTCAFLSFINEGDPVPRADREYVRSLIDLYASSPPTPMTHSAAALPPPTRFRFLRSKKHKVTDNLPFLPVTIWQPPPGTLSNAGRLVVLRQGPGGEEDIRACVTNDQELRRVMFGDPFMHLMRVYMERLEVLATNAVMGRGLV